MRMHAGVSLPCVLPKSEPAVLTKVVRRMKIHSALTVARFLSLLLLLLYLLYSSSINMDDLLHSYSVNSGLSQDEFVLEFERLEARSLRSLRSSIFNKIMKESPQLIPTDVNGLPLVSRRDSALRPAVIALSKDIWCLIMSDKNHSIIS